MATFEEIRQANQTIQTTDIKGKEYAEVNQRVKAFRMVYPNGAITTEILFLADGVATMKATAYDETGRVLGCGHAREKEASSYINKTSYIENCETSAVGRALGMCGFGVDTSICSAEELQNALANQGQNKGQSKGQNQGRGKQTDADPLGKGEAQRTGCESCGKPLTPAQRALARQKYGRLLCPSCQAGLSGKGGA